MNERIKYLIDKLSVEHSLSVEEYTELVSGYSPESAGYAAEKALCQKKQIYGDNVYIRGLVEISNICKNDCIYCGIRKSNKNCNRYRLTDDEIFSSCERGYDLGFRTFVLQGGEDGYFTDSVLVPLIERIKKTFPDCAITLSLGERSRESYEKLFCAGADRYLLRHETASKEHYSMLHPADMSFDNRIKCLKDLKEIGYQVGCGFMVGSPEQRNEYIALDLKFIEEFSPDMCGIGPFIPHKDTEYKDYPSGSVDFSCYLLSLIRLIKPSILLPATTALGSLEKGGREKGILAGANVVMPNLSPMDAKKKYTIYDNKLTSGAENAEQLELLKQSMEKIGARVVIDRGDAKKPLV